MTWSFQSYWTWWNLLWQWAISVPDRSPMFQSPLSGVWFPWWWRERSPKHRASVQNWHGLFSERILSKWNHFIGHELILLKEFHHLQSGSVENEIGRLTYLLVQKLPLSVWAPNIQYISSRWRYFKVGENELLLRELQSLFKNDREVEIVLLTVAEF